MQQKHITKEINEKLLEFFSKIKTKKDLDMYSYLLKHKLELVNPATVNKIKLDFLISNLMALIIFFFDKDYLNKKTFDLLEYLIEKDLIPKIYLKSILEIFFKTMDNNYSFINFKNKSNCSKKRRNGIKQKYNINLDILFNEKKNNDLLLNKNFGYSILDLNGDFIWADEKSQRLFEFKFENSETKRKNLFGFLIPFSYDQIIKKFSHNKNNNFCEIFENKLVGDSVNFSYIIYSKSNLNKYIKQIKKKKIFDYQKLEENFKSASKGIFYRYLKALSSRASLILLKFNFKELKVSYSENETDINFGSSIKNLFKNFQNISEEEKNKNIYRISIFLETRYAKKIPNYDFNNMKNDKKIKEFEKIVKKKMNF